MGGATRRVPKPMIEVGKQPILWHIMRWYASWGHQDFILCLGYRANAVRDYFLSYDGDNPDARFSTGPVLLSQLGWHVTFLDTGLEATIGDRLRAASPLVDDDEVFLCTYGDGLTDAPLDEMIERLVRSGKTGLFMSVRPRLSYHAVDADDDGNVHSIEPVAVNGLRVNGGFFVFRRKITDEMWPDEDIMDTAARLATRGEVLAYRYDGFWAAMDTMKDKQDLDAIAATGDAPWTRAAKLAGSS